MEENTKEEVATNNNPAQSTEPTNSDNSNFNKDSIIDTTSNATASSSNNNNIADTNISTATNIGKAAIDAEKILFEDKVITKHTRLVNLVLKPDSILWNEKGLESVLSLNTVVGVTRMEKFFTLHVINTRTKETITFKCQTDDQAKIWDERITEALNPEGKGPRGCRVVFVVNPFSGTKKAVSVFNSVRNLFDIAGMKVTVIETARAGHARDIGREIDPSTVDRLVCVSGDGLFNELINGLLDREDWEAAIKIPLCVLPAGSGNGIAASVGNPTPIAAALSIIKGFMRPVDIIRTTQNGVAMYGFLSLTWAMISDVDIESDKLRWMGPVRFSVGALKRIISLRKYKGKITYLPAPNVPETHAECVSFENCPRCKDDHQPISPLWVLESGKRVLPSYMFDVTQPPPPEWRVIDDEFVIFIATNVAWISTDFMASPHAHLSDGAVDLVLVRATPDLSRAKMVSLLLQTEDDINSPHVEHYKVKALYLDPQHHPDKDGGNILAVDGEKIPYAPVGVEVFRGLINMLCLS